MAQSLTTVTRRLRAAAASDRVVQVSPGHAHIWRRLPGSVGLFACQDRRCLWCAVCPGCLGSLDVALRVQQGIEGLVLSWCPAHHRRSPDEP